MTRAEAIEVLRQMSAQTNYYGTRQIKALDMAILTLEQIAVYDEWVPYDDSNKIAECVHRWGVESVVKACEGALEEPKLTQDNPSATQDCISREAVMSQLQTIADAAHKIYDHRVNDAPDYLARAVIDDAQRCIKLLPSVQPERTAEWIYKPREGSVCSACNEPCLWKFNYCPNCGARMKGDE